MRGRTALDLHAQEACCEIRSSANWSPRTSPRSMAISSFKRLFSSSSEDSFFGSYDSVAVSCCTCCCFVHSVAASREAMAARILAVGRRSPRRKKPNMATLMPILLASSPHFRFSRVFNSVSLSFMASPFLLQFVLHYGNKICYTVPRHLVTGGILQQKRDRSKEKQRCSRSQTTQQSCPGWAMRT